MLILESQATLFQTFLALETAPIPVEKYWYKLEATLSLFDS
jgi:hypothetical protein